MSVFFTSDSHYCHANIIRYCSRPFSGVEEMNREMIRRWNARVKPTDTVYHLGDFAFAKPPVMAAIRHALNGRVILVRGNHDRSPETMLAAGFDEVCDVEYLIGENGERLTLRHKPLDFNEPWPLRTDYFLHGHVHENWKYHRWATRPEVRLINVGVDVWDFAPRRIGELVEGMSRAA